jgi:creatinine amidohydrolase/Fe(II)-dependent formamide hydrolase-like protein
LMLVEAPDHVRDDVQHLEPVWIDLPAALRAGAKTFAEAGATLGYFGDPAAASSEEGEAMFAALAQIYVTAIRERLADREADSEPVAGSR